ncbi:chitinase-3-like protein 1 [Liolophura sinensis]|uniref:chitinase-3-like protein 1 n=1 Tax=Liolophura sinensis TaxID=3198878 RepID=UPI0031593E13
MSHSVGLAVFVLAVLAATCSANKKIFCYFSSSAQYKSGIGKFLPENIEPSLCTHVIFAFVDVVHGYKLEPSNWNDLGSDGLYARTVALKKKNPRLKVLLAVGGWFVGSEPFVSMISNVLNRKAWVANVVKFLRLHGFDGLDMDWEFPGVRGSPPEDKYRFTTLMREIQDAFKRESWQSRKEKLILTLATAAGTYYISHAYEPEKIVHTVDYMLLMTYNYHGQWENTTGHHSGLYPNNLDRSAKERALCVEWSVKYWLGKGMSRERLIMGIATYGMSYTLKSQWQNGIKAPAYGAGAKGKYTNEKGILSYPEVCENIRNGWKKVDIPEQYAPYATGGNQWVGYEDVNSVRVKAEYLMKHNLAGAFIWSVEMDDFTGHCGQGRYPLLSKIYSVLNKRSSWTKPVSKPIPAPQKPNIAAAPADNVKCWSKGLKSDPASCSGFYVCVALPNGSFAKARGSCPSPYAFDYPSQSCVNVWGRCG